MDFDGFCFHFGEHFGALGGQLEPLLGDLRVKCCKNVGMDFHCFSQLFSLLFLSSFSSLVFFLSFAFFSLCFLSVSSFFFSLLSVVSLCFSGRSRACLCFS